MRSLCLLSLLAGLFFAAVRGDLPVHCEKRRQLGVWHMKRCSGTSNASVPCGHTAPDRVTTMPDAGIGWSKPGFDVAPGRDLYFSLKNPNVVRLAPPPRGAAATARAPAAPLYATPRCRPPPAAPSLRSDWRRRLKGSSLVPRARGRWSTTRAFTCPLTASRCAPAVSCVAARRAPRRRHAPPPAPALPCSPPPVHQLFQVHAKI